MKPEVRTLLEEWRTNCYQAMFVHRFAGKRYGRVHSWIGIPLVVLTAFVGLTVSTSLNPGSVRVWTYLLGGMSILGAILAGLQTFLRLEEKSRLHLSLSSEYASVRRQIDQCLALDELSSDVRDSIRAALDQLSLQSPGVPERFFQMADTAIQRGNMRIVKTGSAP